MRKRKGLSSVVGTVFSIIALATTIGYVTYSMNVLSNFNQATMTKNQADVDTNNEELQVVKTSIANGKFNITVQNTGNIPINLTRLWVENKTTTNWIHKYDLNTPVYPGQTTINIGQSLALYPRDTYAYNMKLVTQRGNTLDFMINSATQAPLLVQAHTIPETVSTEFDTVVLMSVTNNATNAATILNLQPTSLPTVDDSTCSPNCMATYVSGPSPSSYPSLKPGETATFKWIYTISGADSNKITFTTSLQNGFSGNTASSTVEVRDIVSSLEAGTAISSQGLSTAVAVDSMLFFHNHVITGAPATPSYLDKTQQLSPAGPEESGSVETIDQTSTRNTIGFFSNNASSYSIGINQGVWNASLRYDSLQMPSTVTHDGNGHIIHFNSNRGTNPSYALWDASVTDCNQEESGASNAPGSNERPTWSATYGVNGSGGVYFDAVSGQEDYYTMNWDTDCVNPDRSGNDNSAFAAWFKADVQPTLNAREYIMWLSNSTSTDYFRVYLLGTNGGANHGRLYFEVKSGDSSTVGSCNANIASPPGYMDGKWHHVVATKQQTTLQLYVDGVSQAGCVAVGDRDVRNTIDCGQNCQLYIGSDNQDALAFKGYMDDVIWFNDDHLNNNQAGVTALIKGFGTGASTFEFAVEKTDLSGGNPVDLINQTVSLPFIDRESYSSDPNTDGDRDIYWAGYNFTSSSISAVTLQRDERLLFSMKYKSGLGLDLLVDAVQLDGSSDPWSSYLQTPPINSTFPSYFEYDNNNDLTAWVYNEGPYGSWFVYQGTRAVFNDINSGTSYAGLIRGVNGTDSAHQVTEHRDSIFIPVANRVQLTFWELHTRPSTSQYYTGSQVPAGTYDGYIFIDGYDERGEKFLRNINLGRVTVCTGCT